MGRNNQRRRAARQRVRHQRGPTPPRDGRQPGPTGFWFSSRPAPDEVRVEPVERILTRLLTAAAASPATVGLALEHELVALDAAQLADLDQLIQGRMQHTLASAYEHGWLPLDLLHYIRPIRQALVPALAAAITSHARDVRAEERAPRRWRDQLPVVADHGPGSSEARSEVLQLLAVMSVMPPLERLLPPPSMWDQAVFRQRSTASGSERDRLLNKIRTLLAKAEATEFAAEAETFTAKAQDLMTRHAIDEALVRAADDQAVEIEGVRVHIHNPYAAEKVQLLNQVARANRARAVWNKPCGMVTVIGTPVDVDQVELLFTSMLIQATRAMAEAGARRTGAFERSASFRRSFLMAYALRIGERLQESSEAAVESYGTDLVPVLKRQEEAVHAEYERLFPRTRTARAGSYNGAGWEAGRAAADRATFTAGRLSA